MPLLSFGLKVAHQGSKMEGGRDHACIDHSLEASADAPGVGGLLEADHFGACRSAPFSAARLKQPRRRPGERPPPAAAG